MNTRHRNRSRARPVLAGALSLGLMACATATGSQQSTTADPPRPPTSAATQQALEGDEARALGQTGRDTAQGTSTQNENARSNDGGSAVQGVNGQSDIHDISGIPDAQVEDTAQEDAWPRSSDAQDTGMQQGQQDDDEDEDPPAAP